MKILLFIVIAGLFLYHSVYFESLSERKEQLEKSQFNADDFVQEFWNRLQKEVAQAVPAHHLLQLFESDMETAVKRYGKTLGVSEQHSYLVKGEGRILSISDDFILLDLSSKAGAEIAVRINYIFGNEIRDASGLVNVSDFPSTVEFNAISSVINSIIKSKVLPPILESVDIGVQLDFFGAATVNEESPQINPLKVVPVQLSINSE